MGCNEVPKAGGGTYWSGDPRDERDFVQGHDPNERKKIELLVDLIDRLKKGQHLSGPLMKIHSSYEISEALLNDDSDHSIRASKAMDLLEFGRIIRAEMSAICDASRKGVAIKGATLYCTTFPCHICAKHIVASGIERVVYLEPYPKSYAAELHGDFIEVDPQSRLIGSFSRHSLVFPPIGTVICSRRENANTLAASLKNGPMERCAPSLRCIIHRISKQKLT